MPISQDRMLALIAIADEQLAARETLCATARAELDEAIEAYYSAENPPLLAGTLLSHLQSLAAAILDNPRGISAASLECIAREREHFRQRRNSNAIAARAMARKRRNTKPESPVAPI